MPSPRPTTALLPCAALALLLLGAPATCAFAAEPAEPKVSTWTRLAPAEIVERMADSAYKQEMARARSAGTLLPDDAPQAARVRAIARRVSAFASEFNPRAASWNWEAHVVEGPQANAWCMPGGKIAVYSELYKSMALDDDELAAVVGHEVAHAVLEHAREKLSKSLALNLGVRAASLFLGTDFSWALGAGEDLINLKFSRDDERSADALGVLLAAKAGYDPRAASALWTRLAQNGKRKSIPWLSTHPEDGERAKDLEKHMPKALKAYRAARLAAPASNPPTPR